MSRAIFYDTYSYLMIDPRVMEAPIVYTGGGSDHFNARMEGEWCGCGSSGGFRVLQKNSSMREEFLCHPGKSLLSNALDLRPYIILFSFVSQILLVESTGIEPASPGWQPRALYR